MATFRSGPRDPVTGATSTVISSGNRVGVGGTTPNERAARESSYMSYEPAAVQASESNAANEARYNQFLRDTGRTATNPYGSDGVISRLTGVSPDKINYTNMSAAGIESINRLAYDQFLNPVDNRGRVRGMLREGSPTQYGNVYRDPSMGQQDTGGLSSLLNFLPGVDLVRGLTRGRSDLAVPTPGFFPDSMGDLPVMEIRTPVGSVPEMTPPTPNRDPRGTISLSRFDRPSLNLPSDDIVNPNLYDESELAIAEENRRKADAAQAVLDSLPRSEMPITAAEVTGDYIPLTPDNPFFFANQPTGNMVPEDMNRRFQNEVRFADLVNPDRDRMLALEPVGAGLGTGGSGPALYSTPGEALLPQTFSEFSGVPSLEEILTLRSRQSFPGIR